MTRKPTESEEEYFARIEFERRKKAEEEKHRRLATDEKKRLKDLHYMKCPKCGMDLLEIGFMKIRIDKCSGCNGVWLDAGELEQVSGMEKTGIDKWLGFLKG